MATISEISAAINEITIKKQTLYKSFIHLQSQTPSSFTLPFTWAHIDSHFTTLHKTLLSKFTLLQTLHQSTRPELISLCQNSDGSGLTRFIEQLELALDQDQPSVLSSELVDAYRFAPDAFRMVLDAMGCEGGEFELVRGGWVVMLEGLVRAEAGGVADEVKDRAMEIAVKWNRMRVEGKEESVLGFLLLVCAYGIVDRFSVDDVVDSFVVVAEDRRSVDLCRRIVPASNVNDIIQKLIDKDMHVPAVKFSIELQKTDKFPPVGLLEQRKLRSLSVIEDARKNVKNLHVCNVVIMKEINTLKSIIKCIEENHLQSEYPKDSVVELVNRLENEVENNKQALVNNLCLRKQPTRAAVLTNDQRPKKQPARAAALTNNMRLRKQPARAAALKNQLRVRKQPARATVLKNQLLSKSKKRELNKGQPVTESAAVATPIQNGKLVQKSRSQRSKSKKRELNKGQQATESAAVATPIQNGKLVQESRSQKSDLLPDNFDKCRNSPVGSGPTGSNAPYASPVVSHDGLVRAIIGDNPNGSNSPLGSGPTGSNAPYASPVVSRDGSTKAVIGDDPNGSNSPLGSGPTGSNAPYASPIASHDGSTRVEISYDFYAQQLQPPSDCNSCGWISD
ncbi:hypothetical protein HanXRQr2_Chr11g0480481 [Helianthus annuus]|uniref:FRIGIDA-like protein n=1 Tax=Helianthus annuus TaxID=4232 RepID=A0A251TCU1_HELAN|nr:FRIGIDA-like protein 1 isoform X1 [Helianthus annuus]KAF5781179.1 hypothetical protein HanXRQr2_Chr11g0480481 [Helianthus annuus]KAJ0500843.1 hypothetical protein HanHA300_Chr11g0393931 [Helianthus annuus]KAJ0508460.1 hypothetical protein HanIR_Chr11g0517481 [Helianthus annuus]KAJ0516716.1 hypothetical protein HanHA89_Chr11g0416921 [Helianthus annuus]KAJ0684719.1 hypothetical protein HanLR1_Chr11g0394311 [Helianthus annuus]